MFNLCGYGYESESIPASNMGDLMELIFCRDYEYKIVIPNKYLSIVISNWDFCA
jgi:hypothetical protein